ncbi:MAG TPA: hypothetical protein VFS21_06305 [Roseiflexaceae bacterium]|nr:hypothetical protein [Roseiflexaceae bacterium]
MPQQDTKQATNSMLTRTSGSETALLSTNPQFLAIIERSRERQQRDGGLTSDQVRQRLGIPQKGG